MLDFPSRISLQNYIRYNPSQDNIDCCTASATLLAAEIIMATENINIIFSRLYLYYMTRKLEGRVGQKGAELHQALRALSLYGVATERQWPFTFRRVDREPHLSSIEEATHYKLRSFEQITTGQYKEYLNRHTPIIIGMITGRRFWSLKGPLEEQLYTPVNGLDNRQSKGHAIVCVGYDDNLNGGSWIIANSLGPKWGFQGYGAVPYACNSDFGESYVITNFAGITPR